MAENFLVDLIAEIPDLFKFRYGFIYPFSAGVFDSDIVVAHDFTSAHAPHRHPPRTTRKPIMVTAIRPCLDSLSGERVILCV